MENYAHILVAIDFTDKIESVIGRAQQLVEFNQARMSFIHVVEPAPVDFLDQSLLVDINLEELILKNARDKMQQLADKYQIDESHYWIKIGSVKSEILHTVEEQNVDLLVVGSHGRHGLELLLGSTANAVLHGASCDVLAVRIKD